jgi:hypothetical protein
MFLIYGYKIGDLDEWQDGDQALFGTEAGEQFASMDDAAEAAREAFNQAQWQTSILPVRDLPVAL